MSSITIAEIETIGDNADHLKKLRTRMRHTGGAIPFVGAGMSRDAGYPGWQGFLELVAPGWGAKTEVENLLSEFRFEEAAEALITVRSEKILHDKIGEIFGEDRFNIGKLASVLLLPEIFDGIVVTTNYDPVLEIVYNRARCPFKKVLFGPYIDSFHDAVGTGKCVLFKVHGDFTDRQGRILSQVDYNGAYGPDPESPIMKFRLPRFLAIIFGSTRPVVFLGCSLEKDRTMNVLRSVYQESEATNYAVLELPTTENERHEREQFLGRYGISPIWYPPKRHDLIEVILRSLSAKDYVPEKKRPIEDILREICQELEAQLDVVNFVDLETRTTDSTTRSTVRKVLDIANLNRTHSMVITGVPGSGKTTALKKLYWEAVKKRLENQHAPIPVWVDLGKWKDDSTTDSELKLKDFLSSEWRFDDASRIEDVDSKSICWYMDSLDELSAKVAEERSRQLRQWIHYKDANAFVIVSCRSMEYSSDINLELPIVELQPLDKDRVEAFTQNQLGNNANAFLANVTESGRGLAKLASNPFHLVALLSIYLDNRNPNTLPTNTGTLFRRLVEVLWRREESRGVTDGMDFHTVHEDFAYLAHSAIAQSKSGYIDYQWAITQLTETGMTRDEAQHRLRMACATGWVVRRGEEVCYLHQLMLAYFAADYIIRNGFTIEIASPVFDAQTRSATRWDQTIIALSGLTPDQHNVINQVAAKDPFLALQCVDSGITRSFDIDRTITTGLESFLNNDNIYARMAAADALASIGKDAIVPLFEALIQSDPDSNDPAYFNKVASIRAYAANALVKIGKASTYALILALWNPIRGVARIAAESLQKLEGIPQTLELENKLLFASVCGSHQACDLPVPSENLELLLSSRHNLVRLRVSNLLEDMGWKPRNQESNIKFAIASENWDVCVAKGEQSVPQMVTAFYNEPNPNIRVDIINTLDIIDNSQSSSVILGALYDQSKIVRNRAKEILKQKASLIDPSMPSLGDPSMISVALQNWTRETYTNPLDYELDWSEHFDHASRRVPSSEVWQNELLPDLRQRRMEMISNSSNKGIELKGKCSLSAGLAFGLEFPETGGWVIEMTQPPSTVPWRSNVTAQPNYPLRIKENNGDANGSSIALVLNIKGDAFAQVRDHLNNNGIAVRLTITIEPAGMAGSLSIADDYEAVSYSNAVRDTLQKALSEHNVWKTHLFFYGPLALAVFLGQRLTSLGEIQCYEYQNPGYVPSCSLQDLNVEL